MFRKYSKINMLPCFSRARFCMKFREVADIYNQIEKVSPKRLAMMEILSDFIKNKYKNVLIKLTLGKFEVYSVAKSPRFEDDEENIDLQFKPNPLSSDFKDVHQSYLNIAENSMMNYIAKLYEKDLQAIRDMYTEKGDLGDVAAECLQNTPYLFKLQSTQLTVGEIIQTIYKIRGIEGKDSYAKKYHTITKILRTNDPLEVKYIIKILLSALRIGVSSKSLIKVLQDMGIDCKDKNEYENFIFELERDVFGHNIREHPELLHINIPVSSMLGRSAKSFQDLEKFVTLNK